MHLWGVAVEVIFNLSKTCKRKPCRYLLMYLGLKLCAKKTPSYVEDNSNNSEIFIIFVEDPTANIVCNIETSKTEFWSFDQRVRGGTPSLLARLSFARLIFKTWPTK